MTYLVDDILVKLDRASMHHSLESRVPLLAHDLVELAFRPSPRLFEPDRPSKWLFKEAIGSELPPGVLQRPKWGFSSPVREWLGGQLFHLVEKNLLHGELVRHGLIEPGYVDMIMRIKANGRWNRLWQLLELEAWFQEWMR
jgi:asparagine synthase (glutamine-hydrolysing)